MGIFDNKDFYPTPIDIIESMLVGIDIRGKVLLEPSAGSGNIVDYLKQNGAKEVLACEISDQLRDIVSKKCQVIENDFLNVKKENVSHLNFIIGNPPFSKQESHILHMWEIAPEGCQVIVLCNNEMYENTRYSYRQSIKEVVKNYGSYTNLGAGFQDAERKTNVEIGLIKLFKPKTESDNEFEGYFDMSEDDEGNGSLGIMPYNEIRNIVNRYVGAVSIFNESIEASNRINEMIGPISKNSNIKFGAFQKENPISRDTFKKELQKSAWKTVFEKLDMSKYVTTSVMSDINKFVEQQQSVPFTMTNIYKMFEMIVGTHDSRMNKVLLEAFDRICGFAEGNATAVETWKTNSNYMVNRKFIHPWICNDYSSWSRDRVTIDYQKSDMIDDIVKALCNLTGEKYEEQIPLRHFFSYPYKLKRVDTGKFIQGYDNWFSDSNKASNRQVSLQKQGISTEVVNTGNEWGQLYDWGFFKVRCYKKGTMHFEFKDENVWYKFNQEVAKIRGYNLPQQTNSGKKKK